MQPKPLKQTVIAGVAVAAALLGSQAWNTKDYTQWTSEEINTVLTDSPWAKQMNVNVPLSNDDRGAGVNRGGGNQGGGYPGGGNPGGGNPSGGGYPGGRGGVGFPGGGIGFPGGGMGGGGRRGGNRNPNGGPTGGVITYGVTLRWESALPIQHALLRQQGPSSSEDAKPAAADQKFYVVSVLGLNLATTRNADEYEIDGQDNDHNKKSDEMLRNRLTGAAQLFPKGQSAIAAEGVQLEGRNGSRAIRFLFPKTFPLSANEKEVKFHFESRGVKFEHTFKLNDMVYQGKLAL